MHKSASRAGRPRKPGGRRIFLYALLALAGLSAAACVAGCGRPLASGAHPAGAPSAKGGGAAARSPGDQAMRSGAGHHDDVHRRLSPAGGVPAARATSATASPRSAGAQPTGPTGTRVPARLRLVMSDEFSRGPLSSRWWDVYDSPGNAGIGLRRPSQVKITHGMLQITADGVTSGGIGMRHSQTYGLYEFRARTSISRGSWSNIVLWPAGGYAAYRKAGELDIAEASGLHGTNAFLHDGHNGSRIALHFDGNFTRWHTWAFEWLPGGLTIWIDGRQVYRSPASVAGAFSQPMNLAMQLDIMRPPYGPAPHSVSTFDVDWVKVYQRAS